MEEDAFNLRDEVSDADLMALLAAGEQWPMGVLYDRYGRLVFSMVVKILHNQDRTEDIVQEVFVRVWRSAHSFQASRGNFVNWLLGIAHHRAIDDLRRQGGRRRRAVFVDDEDARPVKVDEKVVVVPFAVTGLPAMLPQTGGVPTAWLGLTAAGLLLLLGGLVTRRVMA